MLNIVTGTRQEGYFNAKHPCLHYNPLLCAAMPCGDVI